MNIVEKYGGTSVGTIEQITAIAQHVKEMKEEGHQLVVVASAMGKTTNQLIAMANQISDRVNKRELDSLLSTGEQRTVTLLAMAIDALGIPAISLTGYQCGFITSHHHAHARIKDINIDNLKRHLDEGKVVVVAGFQGATENGEITTLGRGGSDTTAVALAAKLGWECHIYTDVNGVQHPANSRVAGELDRLGITSTDRSIYWYPLPSREVSDCGFEQNQKPY